MSGFRGEKMNNTLVCTEMIQKRLANFSSLSDSCSFLLQKRERIRETKEAWVSSSTMTAARRQADMQVSCEPVHVIYSKNSERLTRSFFSFAVLSPRLALRFSDCLTRSSRLCFHREVQYVLCVWEEPIRESSFSFLAAKYQLDTGCKEQLDLLRINKAWIYQTVIRLGRIVAVLW